MERRNFLQLGGAAGALSFVQPLFAGSSANQNGAYMESRDVKFTSDGLDLSPLEYSQLLQKLAQEGKIQVDNYSLGGVVEELEKKFALLLGKESAVFMPSGTLANQIALRKLAGDSKRVIVQAESHVYNDTGDSSQTLSGLNLIPLGSGQAGFTLDEVKQAVQKGLSSRVELKTGAICIESPVRRKNNEMFPFEEMQKISSYAKENNIRMHFDGARMFNMPYHSGKSLTDYTSLFDTVYVSLYKCFNAASGAVLAGPKSFTDGLFQTRRMFGGGLPQVWPFAVVALQYADSYLDNYSKAWKVVEEFIKAAQKNPAFAFEIVKGGSSVFKMTVKTSDPDKFAEALKKKNILLPHPSKETGAWMMRVNTTCNRTSGAALSKCFIDSLN